jgi:hypothetical protein
MLRGKSATVSIITPNINWINIFNITNNFCTMLLIETILLDLLYDKNICRIIIHY